ncbi:MAG TPA: hypothetical protein VGM80_13035 [Gaiellaceae bacterium]
MSLLGAAGALARPVSRTAERSRQLRIVLQAVAPEGTKIAPAAVDKSVAIMRKRLGQLGLHGTIERTSGTNRVVVLLSGKPSNDTTVTLSKRGLLELYDLTPALQSPSIDGGRNAVAATSVYGLLAHLAPGTGAPSAFFAVNMNSKRTVAGPATTRSELRAELGGKLPSTVRALPVPARDAVLTCSSTHALACPGLSTTPAVDVTYYYLVKHGARRGDAESPYPQLTDADLQASAAHATTDPNTGAGVVLIRFKPAGNARFKQITGDEARRGKKLGIAQSFAIVLDHVIYTFPTIDYTAYPQGFDPTPSGAGISGLVSVVEARDLAVVLRSRSLPLSFERLSVGTVG